MGAKRGKPRKVPAIYAAREFVCFKCKRPDDETLGFSRGPLRDCGRCKTPLYALLIVQTPLKPKRIQEPAAASLTGT